MMSDCDGKLGRAQAGPRAGRLAQLPESHPALRGDAVRRRGEQLQPDGGQRGQGGARRTVPPVRGARQGRGADARHGGHGDAVAARRLLPRAGRWADAKSLLLRSWAFQKKLQKQGKTAQPKEAAAICFQLGSVAMQFGEHAVAEEFLGKAIGLDAHHERAKILVAKLAAAKGGALSILKATESLRAVLSLNAQNEGAARAGGAHRRQRHCGRHRAAALAYASAAGLCARQPGADPPAQAHGRVRRHQEAHEERRGGCGRAWRRRRLAVPQRLCAVAPRQRRRGGHRRAEGHPGS